MSLKSKVQKAVDIAFDKLKDLAVTATFDNKTVTGFDFGTSNIVSTDQSYTTIGFLGTSKTYEAGVLVTTSNLTIRNDKLISFSRYSRVTIDGVEYGCNVISKDEFIVVLSLAGV